MPNWMIPARKGIWERRHIRIAWVRPSNGHKDAKRVEEARNLILKDKAPQFLVDANYNIIKGHHIYDAYVSLGIPWVTVGVKVG